MTAMEKKSFGIVYLVGAGPGDPGLLTVRAAELLKRADVVFYDALVNKSILRLANKSAELIYAGKRSKDHAIPQVDLNQLLIDKAREGKNVVRLKGGDPYIFGRGGEEAEELRKAKVSFEVVPGISSTVAAPNYAGIPVTHRSHCSSYTVITGHEDPTKPDTVIDWKQVAQFPGTKIVLMGVERIGEIAEKMILGGAQKTTPIAMIRWGTTGKQQTLVATLGTIADSVKQAGFAAPAVTVIGDVVKLRPALNWFEERPLFGKRVVVTRTREQASQFSEQLMEKGAEVLEIPTIKITPPGNLGFLGDAMVALNTYDWIVFTSPNGVTAFFEYFFKGFDDLRCLGALRIAAVGPATAAKLKELHLAIDVMPEEYIAGKIAVAMEKFASVENSKVLLLRAEVATPELPQELTALGAIVDDVPVYKTVPETEDLNGAAEDFLENGADWIAFTSSSTVENFHSRFNLPEIMVKHPHLKILSIGPETTKALTALELTPALQAQKHTIQGMVDALLKASVP
ncbi:MAG: uroporphyrin-III C-methyltransferase [Verrucomicrobiales bacterium]|nr:uroporphyrin-III C-methyltransferase [Verrucomicrobiales bacterium]